MMIELILEIVLKGALVLPALIKDAEGTIAKVEDDPALKAKVVDVLTGLDAALGDVIKAL